MSPVTPASPERIPVAPESVPVPLDDSATPTVPMDSCSSPGTPSKVEAAVPDAPKLLPALPLPPLLPLLSAATVESMHPEEQARVGVTAVPGAEDARTSCVMLHLRCFR